ncbi:MAG: hypothetical protein SGPRY_012744 [Prymnesium sp.]
MRRAQSAKVLLDATYPDTQPQDYDQVTWLAGMGSRLSVDPSNFTREITALPSLIRAAVKQLATEPAKRASSAVNRARVRNATALLVELAAIPDPSYSSRESSPGEEPPLYHHFSSDIHTTSL